MCVDFRPLKVLLPALFITVFWVGVARAAKPVSDSNCHAANTIFELEPNERADALESCDLGQPPDDALAKIGLQLDSWKAIFFARLQMPEPSPTSDKEIESALTELLESRKCSVVRRKLDDALEEMAQGIQPDAPSLVAAGCDLPSTLKDHWLLTIPDDSMMLAVWSTDGSRATPLHAFRYQSGADRQLRARLVLMPKDNREILVEMRDSGLDVPLTWTLPRVREDFILKVPKGAGCLLVNVLTDSTDPTDATLPMAATLIIDGQVFTRDRPGYITHRMTHESRDEDQLFRWSVSIPKSTEDSLDVAILLGTEKKPWATRLQLSEQTRQKRCTEISYDLRGVSGRRYGLASLDVDVRCQDQGINAERIRAYVDAYVRAADGHLIQLEAWAESLERLQRQSDRIRAQGGGEVGGGDRGPLDNRKQSQTIADQLIRVGANHLLTIELTCPTTDPSEVVVSGRTVDFQAMAGQPISSLGGYDTDKLLDARSHASSSADLREALDVVLGALIEDGDGRSRGSIRLVGLNSTIFHGRPSILRAVVDSPTGRDHERDREEKADGVCTVEKAQEPRLEIAVMRLRETEDVGVCEAVVERNLLDSADPMEDAYKLVSSRPPFSWPAHNEVPRSPEFEDEQVRAVELGALPRGRYVVFAIYGDLIAADCFEVVEVELDTFVRLSGGGLPQRGTHGLQDKTSWEIFARTELGLRFTPTHKFEVGSVLGYEYSQYSNETNIPPSPTASDEPVGWSRHGALFGAFVGVRLPFSSCSYFPPRASTLTKRCRPGAASVALFAQLQVTGNVGVVDLSALPAELWGPSGRSSFLDADIDVSVVGGIRYRAGRHFGIGAFGGAVLADVDSGIVDDTNTFSNDFTLRGILGLELSWAVRR